MKLVSSTITDMVTNILDNEYGGIAQIVRNSILIASSTLDAHDRIVVFVFIKLVK